jgi:hypothetical protein
LGERGKKKKRSKKKKKMMMLSLIFSSVMPRRCRVFEDYQTSRSYYMALGLEGFRIVQNAAGQHAEYSLIVCMNSQTYCIWKRYNHFAALVKEAERGHSRRQLKRTFASWESLEKKRKWWRCLNVPYLALKYSMLETFLKELVYEIKSPALLIKFASGRRYD